MPGNVALKLYDNSIIVNETDFNGSNSYPFSLVSGSRIVISLAVTAIDAATSVSVRVDNSFSSSIPYEVLDTLSRSSTGQTKLTFEDTHQLFNLVVEVTGGNATFQVGVSVHDNATTAAVTISNPSISVDLSHVEGDSVRLGDGITEVGVTLNNELKTHDEDVKTAVTSLQSVVATEVTLAAVLAAVDNVESLLTAIGSNTDGLEGFVDGIEGLLTTIRDNADTVEALLTAIGVNTDGLEALITASNVSLASIDSKVLTDAQLRASPVPVSAASLPLPTGAATETTLASVLSAVDGLEALATTANTLLTNIGNNTDGLEGFVDGLEGFVDGIEGLIGTTNTSLSSIDAGIPAALGQTTMAASMPVVIASNQSTIPVSLASLPLPSGAATETTLASVLSAVDQLEGYLDGVETLLTAIQAEFRTGTAAITSVSASASSVPLLASNANRKKFSLYNDSNHPCRVAFGATASSTAFTILLGSNENYISTQPHYTGAINGIWTVASGSMRITEFT